MLRFIVAGSLHAGTAVALAADKTIPSLQLPHAVCTPAQALTSLAQECEALGITSFDVYGDFSSTKESSYLRSFEAEIASDFGKEDAVFMPSGVMAQSIALLIHSSPTRKRFACHDSSHLLLHEQEAYEKLLHMEPVVIHTDTYDDDYRKRPMGMGHVEEALKDFHSEISTLILEVPHRELGGKCTPWSDIQDMRNYCNAHDIKFHLDGARILEATAWYEDLTLKELVEPFDSVYISFYKGLAGLSGAMLIGDRVFCDEARVWLRRFGGNLYTLLPYAVSGWSGYRKHWVGSNFTFRDKRDKLRRIVQALSDEKHDVSFDPKVPQVNMVHGYLPFSTEECMKASDVVKKECGIRVLNRVQPVGEDEDAFKAGFRSKFEWTMGEANGSIEDEVFIKGWKAFATALDETKS